MSCGKWRDEEVLMEEQINKRRKIGNNQSYIWADFILGSATDLQWIWSVSKYVFSDTYNNLNTLGFEEIMFLKYN